MPAAELHTVEDAVEKIARELETGTGSDATWSVLGEPTAGKSAVLEGLHDHFARDGSIRALLVTPPPRAYDAAHAALIDIAGGLDLNQAALDLIRDPTAPWDAKLKRIRAALGREGRFVMLLDEPDTWSPHETYFTTFVHDIWNLVFDGLAIPAVTAGPTPVRVRRHHAIRLDPASSPDAVLGAIDAPSLVTAKNLVEHRFGASLPSISPLQIRLLVAIAAFSELDLDRIDATAVEHRAALVEVLADLVDDQSPLLRDLWLRLAAVREPFDRDLLGLLRLHQLAARDAAIATQCLLFARRGGLVLHESLRSISKLIDYDKVVVHSLLAKYYRHRFDDPQAGTKARLRDSIEAFHHASNAGIFELETYQPFFVDQLNILGYHLSVDERDPATAAEVFQVALNWDPSNAYAAHYRAFNLDRQAGTPGASVDPDEVERLYRLAVDERPEHAWFWSRLINFLIAQSRIDDAWSAWLDANEAFEPDPSEPVYFGLHLHVARNLLYRGELRHTQTVLRGLPPEVAGDSRFRAIHDRLWALREAQEHGSYVPAIYLKPDWWRFPKRLRNTGLTRWLAAKVASVSSDVVELDVADITPGVGPEYGYVELPLKTLADWWKDSGDPSSLQAGEFLEIGFYGDDGQHVVAVRHPRLRWEDSTYPNEDDPDRYLRAAV
ncbi:MAG: hypothetical protein ACLP8S_17270 [Solirubrobacteraceae bacterium]